MNLISWMLERYIDALIWILDKVIDWMERFMMSKYGIRITLWVIEHRMGYYKHHELFDELEELERLKKWVLTLKKDT